MDEDDGDSDNSVWEDVSDSGSGGDEEGEDSRGGAVEAAGGERKEKEKKSDGGGGDEGRAAGADAAHAALEKDMASRTSYDPWKMERDRSADGSFIAAAMLDLFLDPQVGPSTIGDPATGTSAGFESRGCSLVMLDRIADFARTWRRRRRIVVRGTGETGLVLRESDEDGKRFLWVQFRTIVGESRENRTIEREYCKIDAAVVERDVVACVGERVAVKASRSAADKSADSAAESWFGTVVKIDLDRRYIVERCDSDQSTSNYTLKFQPVDVHCEAIEEFRIVPDESFTTKDACEEIIQPLTRRSKRSLIECLATVDASSEGAHCTVSMVGEAEAFISHAWKYEFSDAVDSLLLWHRTKRKGGALTAPGQCYLWFDIATVPQHPEKQLTLPEDYFYNEFREGVKAIGNTVLIMIPANDPIPLTRAWCVWEIFCTLDTDAKFETALTPADQHCRNTRSMLQHVSSDVSKATSWNRSDTIRILEACERIAGGGGCKAIDAMVLQAFALDQVQHGISVHEHAVVKVLEQQSVQRENLISLGLFLQFSSLSLGAIAAKRVAQYLTTLKDAGLPSGQQLLEFLGFLWSDFAPASSAVIIAKAIRHVPGLAKIDFTASDCKTWGNVVPLTSSQRLGPDFGLAIAESIDLNPCVRSICLVGTAIGALGFAALIRAVASAGVISLSVCKHDDSGVGGSLWRTPEEEETAAGSSLCSTPPAIGTGAQAFVDALATSDMLMYIDVSDSSLYPIDNECASAVASAVRSNYNSIVFDLVLEVNTSKSVLSDKINQELKSALLSTRRRNVEKISSDCYPSMSLPRRFIEGLDRVRRLADYEADESQFSKAASTTE